MPKKCKHKWHIFEKSEDGAFCTKGCQGRLSREEVESRLNEYETLKKAMERLSVEDARVLGGANIIVNEKSRAFIVDRAANSALAYADILEGK